MPADIYDNLGVVRVINAVGYATRVGGGRLSPHVAEAMRETSAASIEIDDLEAAASELIARCIGSEAGIVTCGAAAALTLGAAACLAGNDPECMDLLPVTAGLRRNEIIYPALGRYDYEHAVRLSGAQLRTIDYDTEHSLKGIARAIGERTAAIGYVWRFVDQRPSFEQVVKLSHAHGLPVLVDAALSLPPVENLRRFSAAGADLVMYSGGKHLGGPQASGILCGRQDLIRSAWVQMVDMDVRPGTWSLHDWVSDGWIASPPRHGIGRSMKVGKETIVGLMTALGGYASRDHQAELDRWKQIRDQLAAGLKDLYGVKVECRPTNSTGQAFPMLQMHVDPLAARMPLHALIKALRQLRPKIILAEDERSSDIAYLYPMCLEPTDLGYVVHQLHSLLE